MARLSHLFSIATDLLAWVVAPPRCAACEAPVARMAVFCPACAVSVERARPAGSEQLAALLYGGAAQRAITRFKYERRPDLARPLGDLLWRAIEPHAEALRGALVVPVPLHPVRLAERGYNQSALLAARVAGKLDATLLPLAVARVVDTPRQATLEHGARLRNVREAFRARQPRRLQGRVVLLVDDVRTTGSTLAACARAMTAVGATRVTTAVLARAE